jgi:hypothetical protein
VRFTLTIPCDGQLVGTVRQVAERVAQCAGYTAADASQLASGVEHAVETVMQGLERESARPQPVDIRFERDEHHLDVWLCYRSNDGDRAAIEAAVSGDAALRQGMDDVEFGRHGDLCYCRLRRGLPRERVDHQCEVPPPDK